MRGLRDGPLPAGQLGRAIGLSPASTTHRAIEAMPADRRRRLTEALRGLVEEARALPPGEEAQR